MPPSAPEDEPSSEPAPAAALPDPAELCASTCAPFEGSCSERAVQVCRANCDGYVEAWSTCPVEVEEALECQKTAEDRVLCSTMAAESCTRLFVRLEDCRAGRVAPAARAAAPAREEPGAEEIPAGWSRVDDADLGVSVLLPASVTASSAGPSRKLEARLGSVEYVVERAAGPIEKWTDKTILRAALGHLGSGCEKSLKLSGRFETGDLIHVSFRASCKDGVVRRGMFRFAPSAVWVTYVRYPSEVPASEADEHLDAFLYGFRR